MTEMLGGLGWVTICLGLLLVLPVVLIVKASRVAAVVISVLWLASPLALLFIGIMFEVARRPDDAANRPENVQAAFGFVIALGIIPWLLVWSLGMVLAFWLRRRRAAAASPDDKKPIAVALPSMPSATAETMSPAQPQRFEGMTTFDLHERIEALARDFGLAERFLPITYFPDNGTPYVHVDSRGFHLAYYDRGQASGQRETRDLNEMLYWVVDQVSFNMASEEVARGISHYDQFAPRLLARQDSMLAAMHPEWHRRWLDDPACCAAYYRREAQKS